MDPINIVLLGVVAFIFWRLQAMLGTKTGTEKPPFDPTAILRKPENTVSEQEVLPPLRDDEEKKPVWHGVAPEGSELANGLVAIEAAATGFNLKEFTNGAKIAYEMILESFAKGDKATMKPLLSKDVFDDFTAAITERSKLGQSMVMQFVGVKYAKPELAKLDAKKAQITMHFVGEMISAKLDKTGAVIEGDQKTVREVHDHWTFERDTATTNPNWKLISTDDEPGQ